MNSYFFGEARSPLYGIYTPPDPGKDRAECVLLCYPISKEYMRAHWAYRQLSERLSATGFHVFRFDYSCTGDSAGGEHEATWSGWVRDIASAAEEVRDAAGVRKLSVVGLRAGAALALEALSSIDADQVILWDPLITGRSYLRDLELARSLESFDFAPEMRILLSGYETAEQFSKVGRAVMIHSYEDPLFEQFHQSLLSKSSHARKEFVPDGGGWNDPASWEARLQVGPILDAIVRVLGGGL